MTEGRDPSGRWAPGNQAGRGNAFAGQIQQVRKMLFEQATPEVLQTIIGKLLSMAELGVLDAIKLVLDRLLGKVPEAPVAMAFELPNLRDLAGVAEASLAVTEAAARGDLDEQGAAMLHRLLDLRMRALELTEVSRRLAALERERGPTR